MVIVYSTDEGKTWIAYTHPVYICSGLCRNKSVSLQSKSADGALKSRVVIIKMPLIKTDSVVISDDYINDAVPKSSFSSLRMSGIASFLLFLIIQYLN
jgi:hypothetical protein